MLKAFTTISQADIRNPFRYLVKFIFLIKLKRSFVLY